MIAAGLWLFAGMALGNVLGSFLRARRKASLYSGFVSWQSISELGFGFVLVGLLGWGFNGLLLGSAIGWTIGLIAFGFALFEQPLHVKDVSWPLAKSMLVYGLPIVGGDFFFWFLKISRSIYPGAISKVLYEVGIYSVGDDLSDKTLGALFSLLAISSWPLVVQTWERKGERATSEFLTQLMRFFLLLCVPAVLALSLLREPFMTVMAGNLYFEGNQNYPSYYIKRFLFRFSKVVSACPCFA